MNAPNTDQSTATGWVVLSFAHPTRNEYRPKKQVSSEQHTHYQ